MNHLLDTNVISELRTRRGDPRVKAWVSAQKASDLSISVVTVIEIEIGIARRERVDPEQAAVLRRWYDEKVLTAFADRILPIDVAVAHRVAPLHVPDPAPRHDALIAGTALARGLTVVTRNVTDFQRAGIDVVNPWDA